MEVFITDSKNKRISFNIEKNDTISTLKNKIINKNKINGKINLLFGGEILEDDQIILDLDIENGNAITYLGEFIAG